MSKGNTFENELLAHVFTNADIANVGDATGLRGSSTAGSLHVGLSTGDVGEGGSQTTSEAAYGNYARQPVARSGAGWTVTGNAVENAAAITFPASSNGPESLTHFHVGTSLSGAGKVLYKGALGATLVVNAGIAPTFAAGALDITEE